MQRFVSKKEWASFKAGGNTLTFYKATQLHHIFGDYPWNDSLLIEIPEPEEYRLDSDGYAEKLSDISPNYSECQCEAFPTHVANDCHVHNDFPRHFVGAQNERIGDPCNCAKV